MRKLARTICFLLIVFLRVAFFGDLLRPKRYTEIAVENYHDEHSGLYELKDDTVDVLYIGSSHVFSSISPEDIFKNYGITGYVQASSCQRVWQSYYYLQEMYYTQSPSVVVLDTFMALDGSPQSEAFNREAIDKMKLSPAKIGAIRTAVDYNPQEEQFMSYLLPILRYHDRWEELDEEDYAWFTTEQDAPAKGFLARIGTVPAAFNEEAYAAGAEPAVMSENCREYLDKIKRLCEEHGSSLVLTKLPTCLWSGASSAAIAQWADENGVLFLDYNADEALRKEADIDWETESLDGGNHLNYDGAMKMSDVFGRFLTEEFSFEDKRNDPEYQLWNDDYDYYKRCVDNYRLAHMTDSAEYARRLKDGGYTVFITCNNIGAAGAGQAKEILTGLGMSEEFLSQAVAGNNLFVLENGDSIFAEAGEQTVEFETLLSGERWKASSAPQDGKSVFSCISGKKEWANAGDGVQFVVWDPKTKSVADSSSAVVNEQNELELVR